MAKRISYTDIGHSAPNDILWVWVDGDLWTIPAGQSRTHELVWGADLVMEKHWKGRYEQSTALCSITPPEDKLGLRRPPGHILEALKRKFSIVRFHFFADGDDVFSPNPKKVKLRRN